MLNPATDDAVVGREAVAAALRGSTRRATSSPHLLAEISDDDGKLYGLVFEAKVGEATLRGVDLVTLDDLDRIVRFEVAARPMAALMALGSRMRAA